MPQKKPKPKIEEVARDFGKAHAAEAAAKTKKEKLRKLFFDLIEIPESQLARQTIYYDGDDPEQHVATLYPKWKIISTVRTADTTEWKLIIQEDPEKKTFAYVNPLDQTVYTRTVAESAPQVDLERMKEENPKLYDSITFQPEPPPRELLPLNMMDEDERDDLKTYLLPVNLTNRMEKPRKAKPEELEGVPELHVHEWGRDSRGDVSCRTCGTFESDV